MAATEPHRLASLPGYDTAPDIYETPELTDDTSTTLPTSPQSPSVSSASSGNDDDEDDAGANDGERGFGISRRRLYPSRARTRFAASSARVDTKNVDLSDRVDGRRRGYKVRRAPVRDDEDEDESLEARIARLRREIEECRVEAEKDSKTTTEATRDDINDLSQLLRRVDATSRQQDHRSLAKNESGDGQASRDARVSNSEQTLGKVTLFESRLTAVEQALGLASLDSATAEATALPILPSLALLDQQLSAVTSASSLSSLDAARSRIEQLRRHAAELSAGLHQRPQAAANGSRPSSSDSQSLESPLSQEDIQKLHAIYGLLPNLQALAPTVPAILERLRSLRALHTNAATAASDLDELERMQAEMDKELVSWKEGLERVEGAIRQASEANGKNGMVVEGWVKDLESRLQSLGR